MTNEEMAIQIQLGHNEYYSKLWDSVHRLMYKILHSKTNAIPLLNYISKEDLEQEMYFAFCNAIQTYDDTKPYKFNSYLDFHIRNVLRNVFYGSGKYKESSYNQTVGDNENTELIDLMPDTKAEQYINDIELTDIQQIIRQAVSELPIKEREIITLFYFKGLNYKQISDIKGITLTEATKTKSKGLHILRQNKTVRGLYIEVEAHYNGFEALERTAICTWLYSDEYYSVKQLIEQRRANGEYISYGQEQSILTLAKQRYIKAKTADAQTLVRLGGGR